MTMKAYRRNVALGAYSLLNIISTSRQTLYREQPVTITSVYC